MNRPDIVFVVEHVARELDVICAIGHYLRARHGLRIGVALLAEDPARWGRTQPPAVVALPYCYSGADSGTSRIWPVWRKAAYFNMACEQVYNRVNRVFKAPRDEFARSFVTHHAWSRDYEAYLREHGVPAAHIFRNGNPAYALYREPYRRHFECRRRLADRFGLDAGLAWVFVPENYWGAFVSDQTLADYVRRGYTPDQARQYRRYTEDSLREAITWWYAAARTGRAEVIVRPRPATPLEQFRRVCVETGGPPPPRLHLIKEGTVREWVLAAQTVVSSWSTTLVEAAIAGKAVYMLTPRPIPEFLYAPWFEMVDPITCESQFVEEAVLSPRPANSQRLRDWAESAMLATGDPIVGLADFLADACCGRRPMPRVPDGPEWLIRSLADDRPHRRGPRQRAAAVAGSAPRPVFDAYERDRLDPTEIESRLAGWSQTLGACAPADPMPSSPARI